MAQITLRDYLQETEDAISSKRVDEAFASCQYILAYFPESLETQRLLGEVYLAQGKLEDAQQAFDWVLTNDPENVVAYCSRALVSELMSDYDTALDCYQQAYELSRGNSQIRQAFNQLSEKSGQPGFMLSRAGLARLYMRGDLLSQAVQEWDVVLAMTPDRLDARTGLLEVYWRLGTYDRAIQLAEQILQDVPGCVKALLLLAYVTAPQDMLRSQELVKKAETVDPDLVMAQDLFADQMASRQGDPFLKLLQKPPVTLGTKEQATQAAVAQTADPFASLNNSVGTVSADALASWGSNANWSNDTTLVKPRSEPSLQLGSKAEAFPSWMSEGLTSSSKLGEPAELNSMPSPSEGGNESWVSTSLSQSTSSFEDTPAHAEPWDSLQDALNNLNPEVVRQISDPGVPISNDLSWSGIDSSAVSFENMPNGVPHVDEKFDAPYEKEHEPNHGSATPAWLSMLNQNESQLVPTQSADEPIATNPHLAVSQPLQTPLSQLQVSALSPLQSQPILTSDNAREQARISSLEADDSGDEELFFGPNWLKTLGAASLDGTDAVDFSLPEKEVSSASEQLANLEQKPAQVSSSWDQRERQASSEKDRELSRQPQAAEEPQTTQEDDAWTTWQTASSYDNSSTDQEAYLSWPDLNNQAQDDQSFWSLPQQENSVATDQAQPSWMSQLSQSNQEESASAYADWASQPSESRNSNAQESDALATSELMGQQSVLDQASARETIDPWAQLSQQAQEQSIDYHWLAQRARQQPPQPPVEPVKADSGLSPVQQNSPDEQKETEQKVITTLEELEQKLLSRGFTPLEPNSLASIAHSNREEASSPSAVPEPPAPIRNEHAEPSLSSALAALGDFSRAGANPGEPHSIPMPEAWQEQSQSSEPLRVSSLREASDGTATTQSITPGIESGFVPISSTPAPAIRMNVLLDSELETTMKRPAVRLQPIHQQAALRDHSGTSHSSRGRSGQRQSESKGNVSYRERLVRGYQAQLIGDFDDAMQEYRLIIRTAPELLGEVVSNVRALLKLAPNYSAGYRVLGDAYMRQGEYLQAMESYNKALTMAKKAKG